ncbi:MAG: Asp-tRNA(Asn)/Glu-tRNA(Gln) amidotransferase subunit GatC, partial [Cardiobacteriaceae bacterium]|nr:Asp-tRNA(Asn)/Glu-tRNA(Gln) amidotransferase subunit GatC [Cardiobacteriaceae bacterium]
VNLTKTVQTKAGYDTFLRVFLKDFLTAMSQLDPSIIAKTAHLAQLEIEESELTRLAGELEKIFALFSAINTPEISANAPLSHPLEETQRLRADQAIARDMMPSIEKNAPCAEDRFITVPKVIE